MAFTEFEVYYFKVTIKILTSLFIVAQNPDHKDMTILVPEYSVVDVTFCLHMSGSACLWNMDAPKRKKVSRLVGEQLKEHLRLAR